jgi:hypothetical protein
MIWVKAGLALIGLLDWLSGQVERWQIRQGAKAEVERDELKALADALRQDKELSGRLLRDPAFLGRVRRHYRRP